MEVILSGKEKYLKKFLKKESLWLKRNGIEILLDDEVKEEKTIENKPVANEVKEEKSSKKKGR